jgi:hypothetical protein
MRALVIALCVASGEAWADPVLMMNEPEDLKRAQWSCDGAAGTIREYDWAIKTSECSQMEQCQRAMDINAVCKVRGPVMALRDFYSKLLAQFASNPNCPISIMRLTDGKSDAEVRNDNEAFEKANWELDLYFTPGAVKAEWQLWPFQNGKIIPKPLQGEGDLGQIARDVCTIMTHGGAKILN